MADITFNYKGNTIGEISASGTHTLDTEGMYCEDDIEVVYVKPSGGTLITKTITENGTYDAEDDNADGYSSVTVNVAPFSFYQEVEYLTIGSSLTFISVPYAARVGDVIECSVSATNWRARNIMNIVGVRENFTSASGFRANFGVAKTGDDRKRSLYANSGSVSDYNDPVIVSSGGNVQYYGNDVSDGELVQRKIVIGTDADNRHLIYGAYSSTEFLSDANLYKLTVTDSSNNKKFELIPCYRKADNVCGFYDAQSGIFHVPDRGSYTAGPDVVPADLALSILLGE